MHLLQDVPTSAQAWQVDKRPEWAVRKAEIAMDLTKCVRDEQIRVYINTLYLQINTFTREQVKEVARMIHIRQSQLNDGAERLVKLEDAVNVIFNWVLSSDVYLVQKDGLRVTGAITEKYFSLQKRLDGFKVNEMISIKHALVCVHKWLNSADVWTVDAHGAKADYLIKVKPLSLISKLLAI